VGRALYLYLLVDYTLAGVVVPSGPVSSTVVAALRPMRSAQERIGKGWEQNEQRRGINWIAAFSTTLVDVYRNYQHYYMRLL
jgi:hypothetical protein